MKVYHNNNEYDVLSIAENENGKKIKLTLNHNVVNSIDMVPLTIKIEEDDSLGNYDLSNIISIGVLDYTVNGNTIVFDLCI